MLTTRVVKTWRTVTKATKRGPKWTMRMTKQADDAPGFLLDSLGEEDEPEDEQEEEMDEKKALDDEIKDLEAVLEELQERSKDLVMQKQQVPY